ncbi:MAG: Exoenzyme regulatory protein AepA in lipid-linked oligosaccharide synthesis cluster [Ilumatobacteraceae bacterium]|nr:Exoenzyme regulatory protein AepA in lipid-linked oligosaccharide synthesis cluster [Ilumatobacteraceae bacterium]
MKQLVRNGTIITGSRRAEAMAIDDGVVVALGDDAMQWSSSWDQTIDLAGGTAIPGFRDGHAHPYSGGTKTLMLDLYGLRTIDQIQQAVRQWSLDHPGDGWIEGNGYDPTLLPNSVGQATWLDVVDRPVALHSTDYHMMWVNSAAMQLAGITADSPDPDLGTVVRNADRSPVGTLYEFGATALIARHLPELSHAEQLQALGAAMDSLTTNGIVWAQDASIDAGNLALHVAGAHAGLFTCRLNMAWRADPKKWTAQRSVFNDGRASLAVDDVAANWLTANTVKFFADGVIEAGTGFLVDPYDDMPGCCGLPNWSPEGLAEAVRAFDADGFQIHIHAIGDGGVRMALDAIEQAAHHNGPRDRRPVVAHTQLVHPADHRRFAQLDVIATFEPLWACLDPNMEQLTIPRLGPERSALQYPIGSMHTSGARISFGSDWPVSSLTPVHGLAVAVTRQNEHGEPSSGWTPDERLPIAQALAAYTSGSAYQAFDDDAGTLDVGRRADFCVLENDITVMSGREIGDVAVMQTYLAGSCVGRGNSGES